MMRQYSKLFNCSCFCDKSVDAQLNEFLELHPNYTVNKIAYSNYNRSQLFVVFNVEE